MLAASSNNSQPKVYNKVKIILYFSYIILCILFVLFCIWKNYQDKNKKNRDLFQLIISFFSNYRNKNFDPYSSIIEKNEYFKELRKLNLIFELHFEQTTNEINEKKLERDMNEIYDAHSKIHNPTISIKTFLKNHINFIESDINEQINLINNDITDSMQKKQNKYNLYIEYINHNKEKNNIDKEKDKEKNNIDKEKDKEKNKKLFDLVDQYKMIRTILEKENKESINTCIFNCFISSDEMLNVLMNLNYFNSQDNNDVLKFLFHLWIIKDNILIKNNMINILKNEEKYMNIYYDFYKNQFSNTIALFLKNRKLVKLLTGNLSNTRKDIFFKYVNSINKNNDASFKMIEPELLANNNDLDGIKNTNLNTINVIKKLEGRDQINKLFLSCIIQLKNKTKIPKLNNEITLDPDYTSINAIVQEYIVSIEDAIQYINFVDLNDKFKEVYGDVIQFIRKESLESIKNKYSTTMSINDLFHSLLLNENSIDYSHKHKVKIIKMLISIGCKISNIVKKELWEENINNQMTHETLCKFLSIYDNKLDDSKLNNDNYVKILADHNHKVLINKLNIIKEWKNKVDNKGGNKNHGGEKNIIYDTILSTINQINYCCTNKFDPLTVELYYFLFELLDRNSWNSDIENEFIKEFAQYDLIIEDIIKYENCSFWTDLDYKQENNIIACKSISGLEIFTIDNNSNQFLYKLESQDFDDNKNIVILSFRKLLKNICDINTVNTVKNTILEKSKKRAEEKNI